jgi:two-component system, LuxR family, sensor kinase FixL
MTGPGVDVGLGWAVLRLFDDADDARLLMSVEREIVLVNRACEAMFGRSRDDLVGRPARVLVPDRLAADYQRVYDQLMRDESGSTVGVNLWGERAAGQEFPVRVLCRMLRGLDGPPLLSVVVLDRSVGQEMAVRDFLESVQSGNVVVDSSGRIVLVNDRLLEMFGYAEDELVGGSVEVLVPDDRPDLRDELRHALADDLQRLVLGRRTGAVGARRDGSTFPVRVLLSSIGSDDGRLTAASVLDLSEMEDLRVESDRLKAQFLATVSHELRTPLTAIIGGAEMLADEVERIEDPALRERLAGYTSMIVRGARRQHALVEDLLALTSVDRGEVRGSGYLADVRVVVENAVHDHGPSARAAGLDLTTDANGLPLLVRADERWLGRAVDCLVSNAVKFTPRGGVVAISAGWGDGTVWLEVTDTGPGIAEEERERVFGRLSRGSAAVRGEVPGAGLGLAIARSVVEASGGTLVVVPPMPGETGARLRMTLPGLDAGEG